MVCVGYHRIRFRIPLLCVLKEQSEGKGTHHVRGMRARRTAKVTLFSASKTLWWSLRYGSLASCTSCTGSHISYISPSLLPILPRRWGFLPLLPGGSLPFSALSASSAGSFNGWISDMLGRKYGSMLAYLNLALAYVIFALWKDLTGFYLSAFAFGVAAFPYPRLWLRHRETPWEEDSPRQGLVLLHSFSV